jgi:pimeloyl-ACP methyl ester carboxylesterase
MTKDIFHLMKQCNFKDQFSDGRKFSFMGHHMGGRIGMLFALTKPYLVSTLGI